MAQLDFGTFLCRLDDELVSVHLGSVTAPEWRDIKRYTGLTSLRFLESLGEMDIDAIIAFYWLALIRSGRDIAIEAVADRAGFNPLDFYATIDKAEDKGAEPVDDAAPLDEPAPENP